MLFYVLNFKTQLVLCTVQADNYWQALAAAKEKYPSLHIVVR